MKFGIKLGNVEIAGAKLENVEFNAEYSMKETIEAYGLVKQILAEGPMLIDMIKTIVDKVDSIDTEDKIVSVRRVPKKFTAIDLNLYDNADEDMDEDSISPEEMLGHIFNHERVRAEELARKRARAEELAKRDMENFLKRLKEQNAKG